MAAEYPFQEDEGYIIGLTDVHSGIADPAAKDVAQTIAGLEVAPQHIFVGGDLTEMGSKYEFDRLKTNFAPLFEKEIPIGWMLGNHDGRWSEHGFYLFEKELGPPYFAIDFDKFVFIGLNSATLLEQHGHFGSAQISWLRNKLSQIGPDKPVILQAHHPFGGPSQFTDDGYQVLELIQDYNVPLILVGHGHSYKVSGSYNHSWIQMIEATMERYYTPISWDDENLYLWSANVSGEVELLKEIPLYQPKKERLELISTDYRQGEITLFFETENISRVKLVLGGQVKTFNIKRDGMNKIEWQLEEGIRGKEMLKLVGYGQKTDILLTQQIEGEMRDINWAFKANDSIFTKPAIDDKRLYFGDQSGTFYALNSESGQVDWFYQTDAAILSAPVLIDELVIFASTDTNVYALNRETGRRVWKKSLPGVIYGGIVAGKENIAVGAGDYHVHALDIETGEKAWKALGWGMIQSTGQYHQGRFIFTSWGGVVQLLDEETGKPVRAYPSGSGYATPGPCTPVVYQDMMLYTNTGSKYYGQSLDSKEDAWEQDGYTVGYASPVIDETGAYLSTLKGEIFKYNPENGEHIWLTDLPQAVYDSSPQLFKDYLVVGTTKGNIWILRRDNGKVVKQLSLGSGFIFGKIRATDDALYVGSMDGTIYAVDVSDL